MQLCGKFTTSFPPRDTCVVRCALALCGVPFLFPALVWLALHYRFFVFCVVFLYFCAPFEHCTRPSRRHSGHSLFHAISTLMPPKLTASKFRAVRRLQVLRSCFTTFRNTSYSKGKFSKSTLAHITNELIYNLSPISGMYLSPFVLNAN